MKHFIPSFLLVLLSCFLILLMGVLAAHADDFIELDRADVTYRFWNSHSIDPMITYDGLGRRMDRGLNLAIDTTIASYVYWNSEVQSNTDYDDRANYGQFRSVALQMRLGVRLFNWLDIGIYHLSRHLLDTTQPAGQTFQQMDAVELTLHLYNNKKTREGAL